MDTAWLEVFRAVAGSGSFTGAAKSLGYTQSAVSRQIAALESDMDTVLFDRLARGVRLTESGRFLLDHAEAVLDRLEGARQDVRAWKSLRAGRVRVGSFPTAGVSLVPRAIARFRAAHPGVALTHADGLTRELAARLGSGDLDVAVLNGHAGQVEALPAIAARRLCREPMLVALPAGHSLARRDAVRLAELADEPWIAGNASLDETLIAAAPRRDFRPRIAYVVREWTAKQGFVAAGLGVTLVPALAAASARSDIVLVPLHPKDTPRRGIYVATAAEGSVSPAASAFIGHIETATAELVA